MQHKANTGEQDFEQTSQGWLIQWDNQGELVYYYDIADPNFQLWPFPEGTGLDSTISYYHVVPNQYVTWAQARLSYNNDSASVIALTKAVWNVGGPTFASMTGPTDPNGVQVDQTTISFGDPNGTLGIEFNFAASSSGNDAGWVVGTQLVRPKEELHYTVLPDTVYLPGNYMLDGCPMYANALQGVFSWVAGDTPNWPTLNSSVLLHEVRFGGDFQTYFMYRPAGSQAIWVPLGVMEWNFDGTAIKQNGVWSLQNGATWSQNVTGQATTHFPTWTEVKPAAHSCTAIPSSIRR